MDVIREAAQEAVVGMQLSREQAIQFVMRNAGTYVSRKQAEQYVDNVNE